MGSPLASPPFHQASHLQPPFHTQLHSPPQPFTSPHSTHQSQSFRHLIITPSFSVSLLFTHIAPSTPHITHPTHHAPPWFPSHICISPHFHRQLFFQHLFNTTIVTHPPFCFSSAPANFPEPSSSMHWFTNWLGGSKGLTTHQHIHIFIQAHPTKVLNQPLGSIAWTPPSPFRVIRLS